MINEDNQSAATIAIMGANALPDEHSYGVYKMLMDVYPAFAKKLFENNIIMEKLVMSNMNPMEILDYPVCGKCETLAAYDDMIRMSDGHYAVKCTCFAKGCGHSTVNPATLREWIAYELRKKVPEGFMDALDFAIDAVSASMMRKYLNDIAPTLQKHNTDTNKKIGILDKDGNPISEPSLNPKYIHGVSPSDIKIDETVD